MMPQAEIQIQPQTKGGTILGRVCRNILTAWPQTASQVQVQVSRIAISGTKPKQFTLSACFNLNN